jgi:hypothetical protein
MTLTSTPAADGLLDLNSITADGFTLIVDDQAPVSISVFWEAWGGADIKEAAIGQISEPAGTGNVDYICGFQPDVLMLTGVQGTAAANTVTRNDASMMIGAASGMLDEENIVAVANDDDASATSDTDSYCKTGECLAMIVVGGGNATARAKMTQWNYDGFRLNWLARAATGRLYTYLAIRGGDWKAGAFTIAGNSGASTTTVVTDRRGVPFAPVGLSFFGCMTVQNSAGTSNVQGRIGFGSATSTSARHSQSVWSGDALGTAAEIRTTVNYASCLSYPSSTGTLATAYDINAVNVDGFQAIVDTAGGVASEWVGFLACGSSNDPVTMNNYLQPATGGSVSASDRVR